MNSATPLKTTEEDGPGPTAQYLEQTLQRLHALLEDDEAEQQETFAYLQQVLDVDRPALRKRFSAA